MISTDVINEIDEFTQNKKKNPDEINRTILVKNVNVNTTKKQLIKFLGFSKSDVESVRERCLPLKKTFCKKKLAGLITRSYLPDSSKNIYIVLRNHNLAAVAKQRNTQVLDNNRIFVDDVAQSSKNCDFKKNHTIFVGRLKTSHTENDLYDLFVKVGEILNIRIIRDPVTRMSKKFGYVYFLNQKSVLLAIKLFNNHEIAPSHKLFVSKVSKNANKSKKFANSTENGSEAKKKTSYIKTLKFMGKNMKKRIKKQLLK